MTYGKAYDPRNVDKILSWNDENSNQKILLETQNEKIDKNYTDTHIEFDLFFMILVVYISKISVFRK